MVVSRVAKRREGLIGKVNRGRSWGLGSVQIEDPESWNGVKRRERKVAGCGERKRS